jgi:hypothetical protein
MNVIYKYASKRFKILFSSSSPPLPLPLLFCVTLYLFNILTIIESNVILTNFNQSSIVSSASHLCPICETIGKPAGYNLNEFIHRIINCDPFVISSSVFKDIQSYKCTCEYAPIDQARCYSSRYPKNRNAISNINNNDISQRNYGYSYTNYNSPPIQQQQQDNKFKNLNEHTSNNYKECLQVHVGMAIKGYNMLHREWVSKEHCFNLCLNTNIRNGHSFDCNSFEHWHRNCDPIAHNDKSEYSLIKTNPFSTTTPTPPPFKPKKICASFINDHQVSLSLKRSPYHKSRINRNKKNGKKMDICVLSNMTILSSSSLFDKNDAVTYYELLCSSKMIVFFLII